MGVAMNGDASLTFWNALNLSNPGDIYFAIVE